MPSMGTDVYSRAFVGVPVGDDDFWFSQTDKRETCPEGHARKKGQGAHCDQDGGKFVLRKKAHPTEGFRALIAHLEWSDDEDEDWSEHYNYLFQDDCILRQAGGHTSNMQDDRGPVVIAVTLMERGGYGSEGQSSMTKAELAAAFRKLKKLCGIVGVKGEPQLYLQQHVSV